jgi:hypothetical protein
LAAVNGEPSSPERSSTPGYPPAKRADPRERHPVELDGCHVEYHPLIRIGRSICGIVERHPGVYAISQHSQRAIANPHHAGQAGYHRLVDLREKFPNADWGNSADTRRSRAEFMAHAGAEPVAWFPVTVVCPICQTFNIVKPDLDVAAQVIGDMGKRNRALALK